MKRIIKIVIFILVGCILLGSIDNLILYYVVNAVDDGVSTVFGSSAEVESAVANGYTFDFSEEEKQAAMLGEISVEDIVLATLMPYGDSSDLGEPAVMYLERERVYLVAPTDEEMAAERSRLEHERLAELYAEEEARREWIRQQEEEEERRREELRREREERWEEERKKGIDDKYTPIYIEGASDSGHSRSVLQQTAFRPEENYIVDFGPSNPTPTVTPKPTPKPTATPAPTFRPTGGPSPTPTQKPTAKPTATPKPTASPRPTSPPAATATPTPRPTEAPIVVSLTDNDRKEIEKKLKVWYKEQTHEEVRFELEPFFFDSHAFIDYMNTFHTPWQVSYTFCVMYETSSLNRKATSSSSISANALQQLKKTFADTLEFNLAIDFLFDGAKEWQGREILLNEYKKVLTAKNGMCCYTEYKEDFREEPLEVPGMNNEWILQEKGFYPVVLLDYLETWSCRMYFTGQYIEDNVYGYPDQYIDRYEYGRSAAFMDMVNRLQLKKKDLTEMQDLLKQFSNSKGLIDQLRAAASYTMSLSENGYLCREKVSLKGSGDGVQYAKKALGYVGMKAQESSDFIDSLGYNSPALVEAVYRDKGYAAGSKNADVQYEWCCKNGWKKYSSYDQSLLKAGDIIFWKLGSWCDNSDHVGIYIGNGLVVDAGPDAYGCVLCRPMWCGDKVVLVARQK